MMHVAVLLLLLLLTEDVSTENGCGYQDVLSYLNLTKNNDLYTMTRPVLNHTRLTEVKLDLTLYAILDVIEKQQKFIPYIWIKMQWTNEHIFWEADEFCGIKSVTIPVGMLWKPDIFIEEMTEHDKAPVNPYLTVSHKGVVTLHRDLVAISTCTMKIYNFPFDIQSCNLTFFSFAYSSNELRFLAVSNSSVVTEVSEKVLRSQDEWIFLNIAVDEINSTTEDYSDTIIYTISMKRRYLLYIVNFLLPLLFLLCLDLASFFISDNGGEKLSFKITVLLAVTVLQLILNDILPSSSNQIPLIAMYCVVIFGLMLLSTMETILVMYLMEKDIEENEECRDDKQTLPKDCQDEEFHEHKKWNNCACFCNVSGANTPCEESKEGDSGEQRDQADGILLILKELRDMEKKLSFFRSSRDEIRKPGYWTQVAKKINAAYLTVYVIALIGFFIYLVIQWEIGTQM